MQQVMRPNIPELIISTCDEDDRILLENVIHLALEIFTDVNISLASSTKSERSYDIRIPFSANLQCVSLREMQEVQNYSPARIADVAVESKADQHPHLKITVLRANARLVCTQYDVIRINKRRRM